PACAGMTFLGFRAFGAVFRAALATCRYTGGIERAAHGVITHTRQVLHPATANQDHGVFLQVVAFAPDVGGHFVAAGQAHTAHLAQSRVRLLRRGGIHAGADATSLRTALQGRNTALLNLNAPWFAH